LDEVTTVMLLVAAMFFIPPVLVTVYLYVSGVFINRRRFQSAFYLLLALFALTIGIGTQLSYLGYGLPATTPVSLSEVLPDPEAALQPTP
jgi:hypothetical protein